ncbi:hypothetical protein DFH08DRAFT_827945 [Mycena albidolilacea]|uniref:Uncharacterized protein n=1 Tax=Mycena albidolilacea TaxID=1033008 RepID=A0AAD7E6K4_9AGAR|nr:hypothetical protein DFH08DRAFT_827945 [Mycena albidolilacea]
MAQLEGALSALQLLLDVGQNKEALGTIQDAAAHERTSSRVLPGTIAKASQRINDDFLVMGLVQYYNRDLPKVLLPRDPAQHAKYILPWVWMIGFDSVLQRAFWEGNYGQ